MRLMKPTADMAAAEATGSRQRDFSGKWGIFRVG